jgi:outer membrane protein assembly factor BamB
VFDGGSLLTVTDQGVVSCLAPEDGRLQWQERVRGTFTASPVLAGGKLYLLDRDGRTTVLDVGSGGEVVSVNEIGEPCETSLAFAGGRVFIRSTRRLWCIGKGPTPD